IDARRLQRFSLRRATGFLLRAARAKRLWQTLLAAERVGLQLFGRAVAPARGDLVERRPGAVFPGAEDGIGAKHRSVAFKGDGLAVDLGQGVHGGTLLGLFLGPAPGANVGVLADLDRDLEAFAVV